MNRLKTQIDQIQFARSVARVSPASIVQFAVESLAGTGLARHLPFLDGVRRYAAQYREFVISADQADPDSPHLYFVRQGMSEKPVPYSAIPKFEDRTRAPRIHRRRDDGYLIVGLVLGGSVRRRLCWYSCVSMSHDIGGDFSVFST